MAKNVYIGARVTKEFKKFLQGECKRKGVSLSKYIAMHSDDNFKLSKEHIKTLMERTKEDLPTFWSEAEKSQITKEFERFLLEATTDFINPTHRTDPYRHPAFILYQLGKVIGNTIVHIDSIIDEHKMQAVNNYLDVANSIAQNLNKLKSNDKEEQKVIITTLKNIIETYAFNFASMAFKKDSFVKIKAELDKIEKTLLDEVKEK
jgi:tRNA/tmRNA/rRNA uracil-C5-methylase (TrmA/RlmC/RlmD family)